MSSITAILWLWAISIFNILVGGLAFLIGSSESNNGSLSDVASGVATSSIGFTMMQFGAFAAVVALLAQAVTASVSENQAVIQTTKSEPAFQSSQPASPEPLKPEDEGSKDPQNEAYKRMYGID